MTVSQLVLNVGGGGRELPQQFDGWEQHLLDIDPSCKPDFCVDAKEMASIAELKSKYDAVYCSHTLEHFYRHDVQAVLVGFLFALKPTGFAEIAVPNVYSCVEEMKSRSLDLDDVWYRVRGQPITFHDTLYGWSVALRQGKLAYAHKCGFTAASLLTELKNAGFTEINVAESTYNIHAIARIAKNANVN